MRIAIIGAGWYGCSIALGLKRRGHEVELYESANHIFAGASGANPARLHQGQHYPRSRITRAYCQEHQSAFLARYGFLTRSIPINLYAVAQDESLVDFGTYCQVLRGEIEFITVYNPGEFGLSMVEGAILTGERHIVIRHARTYFENELKDNLRYGPSTGLWPSINSNAIDNNGEDYDWTIDCTFCANDRENIDRYEPCLTTILEGPSDKAVTIMDGPFPSIYPWDEEVGLSSLTSAKLTPFSKTCRTWEEANQVLNSTTRDEITARGNAMIEQMCQYWPNVRDLYKPVGHRLAIRAMPKSAADARLVDIVRTGERSLRVRAGKIDAVIHAEKLICEMINA